MMFQNIPDELKQYVQFVVWRFEDTEGLKPTKVPYSPITGDLADVTDSNTWGSFEAACKSYDTGLYSGIGFVVSDADPFAFIDLDDPFEKKADGSNKHDNPQELLDRQIKIFNEFDSYSEVSPSGKGLHIIIKGSIESGRRRGCIEIYSNMRYMTMTGNVYKDAPIKDKDELLNVLYEQMGEGKSSALYYAGLEKAKYTNERILEIASSAENSEKFNDLYYDGNWQKYYPSQSEGDFALVDILAFYSENRKQVQDLFLSSKLAERKKSRAQYRINYMLNRCFDRMLPPIDIDAIQNQIAEVLEDKRKKEKEVSDSSLNNATPKNSFIGEKEIEIQDSAYPIPPGLMGDIARFIHAQAVRPVPEIALAGAIGLMAGVCGRAYNISGTGLNQYVMLVAKTGRGKEAMKKGIEKLFGAISNTVPASTEFMGPAEISSPQALIKYFSKTSTSFLSLVGEYGMFLKQLSAPNAPSHMSGLKRMMLVLYNASGDGDILRPTIYSDQDKNTTSVNAPAFSLLGESTPEKFFEALTEDMITDGFLPRFTMMEYGGNRPPMNENAVNVRPSFDLVEKFSALCSNALMLNSQNKVIHIQQDEQSKSTLRRFGVYCDELMNNSSHEVKTELWNRAHLKALKLAGCVAVGCNPYDPIVTDEMAQWAIDVVLKDVNLMLKRFDLGDIGTNNEETKQLVKLMETIKNYIIEPWSKIQSYKVGTATLHSERIIPYSYLHKRLGQIAAFRNDRKGPTQALKVALKTMIERGDIQELPRAKVEEYGIKGVCYVITNVKAFEL